MCEKCDEWRKQAEHWMRVADQEAAKSASEWSDLVRQLRRDLRRAESMAHC
jgi:hypothetical protein